MLDADAQMIRAMERSELQARASRRKTDQVEMTPEARALFSDLRNRIMAVFPTVIEMAEARSVIYHDPEFFLEAIPRKCGLSLLIGIDFNEVEETTETVQDTSAYTFIMNSTYQGGVPSSPTKTTYAKSSLAPCASPLNWSATFAEDDVT